MLTNYVIRSLIKRFRANLVTVISIALFVAGCAVGLAFYFGQREQIETSTPPENILVLARGAATEAGSRVSIETARKVLVLEGIRKDSAGPLAARELIASVGVSTDGAKERGVAPIRGIDEQSYKVRNIQVTGAAPAPGTLEVIVGEELQKRYPNLTVGASIKLLAGPAPITGTFRGAPGDPANNELWTPRAALEMHIKAQQSSSMMLVAENAARVPELVATIKDSKDIDADAYSLRELRASEAGLEKVLRVVMLMIVLLSVVAGLAIATTMIAAVAGRMPELAALVTIGIRRGSLGRMILLESLLLAALGSCVGLATSFLAAKVIAKFGEIQVDIMTSALLISAGIGLLVGLLGGLIPARSVRRMTIIDHLR